MESSFSNSTMHPSISLASPDKIADMQSSTILAAAISFTFFFQNTSGAACSSFLLSFCTFLSDSICNKQDSSISSSPSAIAPKHWSKIRSALNRSFCSSQSIESFFVALNVVVDVVVLIIGLLPNLRIDEEVWVVVVVVVVATSNKTRWWWQQIIFSFTVISLLSAENRVRVYYFWRRREKERERSESEKKDDDRQIFFDSSWLDFLICDVSRTFFVRGVVLSSSSSDGIFGREETEKKKLRKNETKRHNCACDWLWYEEYTMFWGRKKKEEEKQQQPKKKKICCACPETKEPRDQCVGEFGAEDERCKKLVEAHLVCLRKEGFDVWFRVTHWWWFC